ncbi:MAG: hypothetical protein M3Y59_09165 [Myxococcota bacterium]|nr:hypothetical protein [Myxococcota bacterium]
MSPALLLLSVLMARDPCDPGPALPADPGSAQAYFAVAEEELARGQPEAARLALREAVRRDPSDPRLQQAWRSACAEPPGEDAGLRQLEAGDCRAAILSFATARRQVANPSLALLQGVCHYELGEDAQARIALTEALGSPAEAETASLYLGLVAMREGRAEEAQASLVTAAASSDPGTAEAARTLSRASRQSARLAITAGLELGHDSNAYLLPDRSGDTGFPDQPVALSLSAVLRPLGPSGPFLHGTLLYRDLRLTQVFDVLHGEVAAGWQWGQGGRFLRAQGAVDLMQLDGQPYAQGYRADLGAAHGWGPVAVWASYSVRLERILVLRYQDYTGLSHRGALFGQWWWGGTGLGLGYRVERNQTDAAELRQTEHGPRLELRLGAGQGRRLVLGGGVLLRQFDQEDSKLGARRADQLLEATASAELDLNSAWQLQLGLSGQKAFSNLEAFEYTRWFATVGLSGTVVPW